MTDMTFEAKRIVEYATKIDRELQATKLALKDAQNGGAPHKVEKIDDLSRIVVNFLPSEYAINEATGAKLSALVDKVNKAEMEVELLHGQNLDKIANNKALIDSIKKFMAACGISTQKTVPYGNRGKTKSVNAGWFEDIKAIVTSDFYDIAMRKIDDTKKNIEKRRQQIAKEAEDLRKKQEAEIAAFRNQHNVVVACGMLGIDVSTVSCVRDIIDVALESDKYLKLAYAMEKTREDWSEGFYRVEQAIRNFAIKTDRDKLIADEVFAILYSDETDGRVWRDCTYNYDVLYGMADGMFVNIVKEFDK